MQLNKMTRYQKFTKKFHAISLIDKCVIPSVRTYSLIITIVIQSKNYYCYVLNYLLN